MFNKFNKIELNLVRGDKRKKNKQKYLAHILIKYNFIHDLIVRVLLLTFSRMCVCVCMLKITKQTITIKQKSHLYEKSRIFKNHHTTHDNKCFFFFCKVPCGFSLNYYYR